MKLAVPSQIMMNGGPITPAMRQWMTSVAAASSSLPWFNVRDYGAVGDGATDDTAAFQRAINAVEAAGGGDLMIPTGRYWFDGVLTLPRNVALVGMTIGPIWAWPSGLTPAWDQFCAVLLPTNTGSAFITSSGGRIADLFFFYPEQNNPDATTPVVYPPTVELSPGLVYRCMFLNSYRAIKITVGQSRVHDCFIGAYSCGIYIDTAYDMTILENVHLWPFYDNGMNDDTPAAVPSSLGNWALANGIGIDCRRVDSLIVNNALVYLYYIGMQFSDSTAVLSPDCGYGHLSNIDIDTCTYGIVCYASNGSTGGYKFTNCTIGEGGATGLIGIYLPSGGSEAPYLQIVGGSIRGTWSGGNYSVTATGGVLRLSDFFGVTDAGALTAPAVPASTVAATNTFPHKVRVHIYGGTTTVVAINGTTTGLVSPCSIMLLPKETVAITYTVAPAWTWFSA